MTEKSLVASSFFVCFSVYLYWAQMGQVYLFLAFTLCLFPHFLVFSPKRGMLRKRSDFYHLEKFLTWEIFSLVPRFPVFFYEEEN